MRIKASASSNRLNKQILPPLNDIISSSYMLDSRSAQAFISHIEKDKLFFHSERMYGLFYKQTLIFPEPQFS